MVEKAYSEKGADEPTTFQDVAEIAEDELARLKVPGQNTFFHCAFTGAVRDYKVSFVGELTQGNGTQLKDIYFTDESDTVVAQYHTDVPIPANHYLLFGTMNQIVIKNFPPKIIMYGNTWFRPGFENTTEVIRIKSKAEEMGIVRAKPVAAENLEDEEEGPEGM